MTDERKKEIGKRIADSLASIWAEQHGCTATVKEGAA